ncbi:hypothetical protein [Microbacterium testaceum]|uniref:hypothetical protein n=1 Tax=Microbacterium testaceum TaxID=2033 RepID=UPI00380E5686
MVTLTISHGHDALSSQWIEFDKILARFTDRGDWSRFKKNHGVTGHAVVTEIKHNRNGWNVHAHLILTLDHQPSPEASDRLQDAVRARWSTRADRLGHTALPSRQAFSWMSYDFTASTMAEYVTKQNLLHHAPDPHAGRYPADLLAGAQQGDADDYDLYAEYLDAATGHALIRQYGHLSARS